MASAAGGRTSQLLDPPRDFLGVLLQQLGKRRLQEKSSKRELTYFLE